VLRFVRRSCCGIGSQKTTRVAVLWMRETYSLRCRLVDHALALPGENKCRVVVREQRALAKGDGVSQSIGESYDVERCLDVDRTSSHGGLGALVT
jgi:hypothetical protein